MWSRHSHLLQPLTTLKPNKVKLKWTNIEQKEFEDIKHIFPCAILLTYPNFNKYFDIHTDASDLHLVEVIIQEGKSIASYICINTVLKKTVYSNGKGIAY